MEEALKLSYANLNTERSHILDLKTYFIAQLKALSPEMSFNGGCENDENSTYTLINVCLPVAAEKGGMLHFQLDLKGIACSKGSACQSGSNQNSHVLSEILSPDNLLKPSVRFSFSSLNTKDEVDYVIEALKEFV
jgi:cysteine desulfurase